VLDEQGHLGAVAHAEVRLAQGHVLDDVAARAKSAGESGTPKSLAAAASKSRPYSTMRRSACLRVR
jgi:hypothetical protein